MHSADKSAKGKDFSSEPSVCTNNSVMNTKELLQCLEAVTKSSGDEMVTEETNETSDSENYFSTTSTFS